MGFSHSLISVVKSELSMRWLVGRHLAYFVPAANGGFDRFWLRAALATIFMGIFSLSQAQDCVKCAIPSVLDVPVTTPEWIIRKQVNEVSVLFVAGRHGKFTGDLTQQDITVLDDNKPPAAILGFRTERELPLRVGILIDTSSSVTSRLRFEQAAASAFMHYALNRDTDLAFVFGFNNHVRLMQDFSGDPDLLSQAVQRLTTGGGTALYDAVGLACKKLQSRTEQDMVGRVLVVLSDGQSNAGSLGLEAAIDAAQQSEVTIYAISTKYPRGWAYSTDLPGQEGNSNLRNLADQTGGRVLFSSRPKNLSEAFAAIDQELRSRYAVSYRPADFTPDGHYRKIRIEARQAGEKLQVRARKGYRARLAFLPASEPQEADRNLPAFAH
jgi:Ca-activated chloride channel family protein